MPKLLAKHYAPKPMKLFLIQAAYKTTNGKLSIIEGEFEGTYSDKALEMAKLYFAGKIVYRDVSEMIFSTPFEVESDFKVVDRNKGKFNIRISDDYHDKA